MTSYYNHDELSELGLKAYGENVLISKKCSLYGTERMSFGNNVRIDDFCILSGEIAFGNYIHIAAYVAMFAGKFSITLESFSAISAHSTVYAESDDYSGESPTNPMIPDKYRTTQGGAVRINRHVIIGAGCIVLPKITIGEGAAVGAMSLVNMDIPDWSICVGIPCQKIKERSKKLLEMIPADFESGVI